MSQFRPPKNRSLLSGTLACQWHTCCTGSSNMSVFGQTCDIQKRPKHKDVTRRRATCASLARNRFLSPWWWMGWMGLVGCRSSELYISNVFGKCVFFSRIRFKNPSKPIHTQPLIFIIKYL